MNNRYRRQIILPEVGEAGQARLAKANVVLVGLGALGSVVAELLCRAGVGKLRLIDFDILELNNLQRQALYTTADVGKAKVDAAKERLAAINPEVEVESVMEHLEEKNLSLLDDCDLVMDGTDNMETRFLINKKCYGTVPVIFTSAVMDKGSVLPVVDGACYACIYEEKQNCENCCENGVLNGATHLAASVAATEGLKVLLGLKGMEGMLSFSLFDSRFDVFNVKKRQECAVCREKE